MSKWGKGVSKQSNPPNGNLPVAQDVLSSQPDETETVVVPVEMLLNFKTFQDVSGEEVSFTVTVIQRRFHAPDQRVPAFGYRIQGISLKDIEYDREGLIHEEGECVGTYSVSRLSCPCEVNLLCDVWPFQLAEMALEIEMNSQAVVTGSKVIIFRPSLVMWRPGINLSLVFHKLKDRSRLWGLLEPKTPPRIELASSKRDGKTYFPVVKYTFLATNNWKAKTLTTFVPIAFCNLGCLVNWYKFAYELPDYQAYFENQLALSLMVVLLIPSIQTQKGVEAQDAFIPFLMICYLFSLFKQAWLSGLFNFLSVLLLLIPVHCFHLHKTTQTKWAASARRIKRDDATKIPNDVEIKVGVLDVTESPDKSPLFTEKGKMTSWDPSDPTTITPAKTANNYESL